MLIKLRKKPLTHTFPQADDIYRILSYGDILINRDNRFDFFENEITDRQKQYYLSAGIYIGVFDKKTNNLTSVGELIFSLEKKQIFYLIVNLILSNEIFYDFYLYRSKDKTINMISEEHKLAKSTANRRLVTLLSWIKWVDIIIKEQDIKIEGVLK